MKKEMAKTPKFEPRDLLGIAEDIGDAELACRFAYRAIGVAYEDETDLAHAAGSVLPGLEEAHRKLGVAIAELRAAHRGSIAIPADTLQAAAVHLPLTAEEIRESEAALKGFTR